MKTQLVAIPWYSQKDYGDVLALMPDAHLLPRTYESWQSQAERLEQRLRSEGKTPCRVPLVPSVFAAWCKARSLDINANARTQFASLIAAQMHANPN